MPSLTDIVRLPDVTGSIIRGTQGRSAINQVREQDRQNRTRQTLDTAFSEGVPTDPVRRTEVERQVFREGGAEAGFQVRDLFQQMSEADREQALREGRQVAVSLAGVQDQATYDRALEGLAGRGVDVSTLPPQFDPAHRDFVVNSARELEDVVTMTPQQLAQELQLRAASRSPGTTVNVGPQGQDFGDPPKDMVFARNPDGSIATQPVTLPDGTEAVQPVAIPIAGGPVAAEEEAAAAQSAAAAETQQRTANVVSTSADNIRSLIESATLPTTGFAGGLLSNLGGTAARDIAASLDTIRANVGFGALQEMRNNSPTGGALGQVSERELALLTATLGNLEQSQSKEQLLRNLADIERQFDVLTGGTPEERDQLLAEAQNIPAMTLEELRALDPSSLSDADLAAADRRFEELNSAR